MQFVQSLIALIVTIVVTLAGLPIGHLIPLPGGDNPPAPTQPAPVAPAPDQPAPAPSPATGDEFVDEFAAKLNNYRAQNGLNPVRVDSTLQSQAARHSAALRQADRLYHANDNVFENVAASYSTPSAQQFFEMWRNSPGHNANMLQANVTKFGIAVDGPSRSNTYYATLQLR